MEICSRNELDIALSVSVEPDKIFYTGPGKSKEEIYFAISKGVKHFSIESYNDFQKISTISRMLTKKVNVTFRINPATCVGDASIKMTGTASQFGFDEESFDLPKLDNEF